MSQRYPLQSLVEAHGESESALARRLGWSGQSLRKAREKGLSELLADRAAVELGLHPVEVWPGFGQIPCAASDCAKPFYPRRAGHRYCSKRCRERIRMRLQYENDHKVREARKAASARYYAEATDYVKARMRRRHQENRDAELARMRARYQAQKAAAEGSDPSHIRGTVAA